MFGNLHFELLWSLLFTHLSVARIFLDRSENVERGGGGRKVGAFADAFAVFCVERDGINSAPALFRLEFRISERIGR